MYQYYYNGGGVAAGDVDNDGDTDLFFTGNTVANKLYRNEGGLAFQDISIAAGITPSQEADWCTGVTMADVNADGWLDIYVSRSGNLQPENRRNLLYINQQDGTFAEQAQEYGLDDPGYSVQAAFFDYDRDGDLDVFLINHGMEYYGQIPQRRAGSAPDPFIGDRLYRNDGGRFTDVSDAMGIQRSAEGYGLGVGVGDLNNDGWDDVYVANDFFEHDYLYLNQAGKSFRESIHTATRQTSFFSMGVDVADFNNDGRQDLVVLDMAAENQQRQKANLAGITRAKFSELVKQGYHHQYMFNALQLNNGLKPGGADQEVLIPSFSNVARLAGVAQTDWSWAPLLADFDNDGWKDLLITNGLRKDVLNNDFIAGLGEDLKRLNTDFVNLSPGAAQQQLDRIPSQKVSNYAFRNQGDFTFQDQSTAWGLDQPTFSNGAAYADLDNDGDLDLIINNLDDYADVYENRSQSEQEGFLRVKLRGDTLNPFGVGTKVTVYQGEQRQFQQLYPTRGFQSSVEPILHFGVGEAETMDSVRVEWYDQKISVLIDVASNQVVTVDYQQAGRRSTDVVLPEPPIFREVTGRSGLDFIHRESAFDDLDYESLLPRLFSRQGPALATGDVNGDGNDDVFVGGARGQAGQLFLQTAHGNFTQAINQPWKQNAESEDVQACLFDADQDEDMDLYVGSGSNEFDSGSTLLEDHLYLNDGQGGFQRADEAIPPLCTNTACVRAKDFDQDGDLDLFVGGGMDPRRYPYPSPSYLLENRDGTFIDATATRAPDLPQLGIVNDAQWTDYNQDGWPDLLVVGEWMPVRFYINREGTLQLDTTLVLQQDDTALTHDQTAGWWQSIVVLDIDSDGDQDYLLGNAGRNQRFYPSAEKPVELFAGDFDENGTGDLLMGYHQAGKLYPVAGREDLSTQMPLVKKLYPNFTAYAQATVPEMLAQFPGKPRLHLRAHTFAHAYLRNLGSGRFALEALPSLAQVASVRAMVTHDVDDDGQEDALLVGNTYEVETKTPRDDAGVGLLLLGTNDKTLGAVPPSESGFYAPHNARGVAVVTGNRRVQVVVANNDATIQVFQLIP
jgi:hypothetical protein